MKTKIFIILILFSALLYGQDGVLVHGWLNTGAVWNGTGVKSVLQNEYNFNRILQPTIGGTYGTYSASQQSLNLRDYLINNSVTNSVAISYSMGGMNTRYHLKRQFEQGQPGRVQYHFTIGSPHIGAMLANNSAEVVHRLIITCEAALHPGGWLEETIEGIGIHYAFAQAANYAGVLIAADKFNQLVFNLGGPAFNDLKMGSNADLYINHPNTNYENNVIKVGIAATEDYPQVYRAAASLFGISENQMLNTVDDVKAWKYMVLISDFINYAENPTPQNLSYLEESLGTLSIFLEFPKTWNLLITGNTNGESDGVVQKSSQIYPNYNRQFYANHTNHGEELNHAEVLYRLREGLNFYGITIPSLHVTINGPTSAQNNTTSNFTSTVTGAQGGVTYQWEQMYPCCGDAPDCGNYYYRGNNSTVSINNLRFHYYLRLTVWDGLNRSASDYHCPTLAFESDSTSDAGLEDENTLLITSTAKPTEDVVDYYLIQSEIAPRNGEINFIIREPETEHTWLDKVEMIEVDVNQDEFVAVTDNGEVINYLEPTNPITILLNDSIDVSNTLNASDENTLDVIPGDVLKIDLTSNDIDINKNIFIILEGFILAKDITADIIFIPEGGGDQDLGDIFLRPNVSIASHNLGNLEEGTLLVEFHQGGTMNYLNLIKDLNTADIETLEMISAVHNEQGNVLELLVGDPDQQYAEIFPGQQLDFVFRKGTHLFPKTEYILKTVGRYETDTTSENFQKSFSDLIIPLENKLYNNFPNPFNPNTSIKYSLKQDGFVSLKVFDILGKEVATLVNENKIQGRYNINFDASHLASGIYIYKLQVNDYVSSKKMLLLK